MNGCMWCGPQAEAPASCPAAIALDRQGRVEVGRSPASSQEHGSSLPAMPKQPMALPFKVHHVGTTAAVLMGHPRGCAVVQAPRRDPGTRCGAMHSLSNTHVASWYMAMITFPPNAIQTSSTLSAHHRPLHNQPKPAAKP